MTNDTMKRASLADIRKMKDRDELHHNPDALEGESLGAEFWSSAVVVSSKRARSVHLRLDPEVFEFFYRQNGGKGHLTRMQNVLRAYANAHRNS